MSQKRETYQKQLETEKQNGKSPVYVDECGFSAEAFRPYAYAPRGELVHGLVSGQKHRTTSLIAANIDGMFMAHSLFEGSCDAERFNTWLEQELCPHLRPEHLVIMDNARFHKKERTQHLIEATGAKLLFLPPYSPDYNPIEHDFANIKRLRKYNSEKELTEIIDMFK